MNNPKLKRLQAIAVSGCATSAFVKDTIDEYHSLSAEKVRNHIQVTLGVIVSETTIQRYRSDSRNTCEICKTEYYGAPTRQSCNQPLCTSDLKSKRLSRDSFGNTAPAPKVKGPVDLAKLRSIANTCTSGWLYGQMGRG